MIVQHSESGMALRDYLQKQFPKLPKYDISFALERGHVQVDGKVLWNDELLLKKNQTVIFATHVYPTIGEVAAMIAYEDEQLLIINKPFNIPSQPTADRGRKNMVDLLRDFIWQRDHKVFVPGVVHRLDKDTTGLTIYLKDHRLHAPINKMFQEHRIQKTYLAKVAGVPKPESGVWESELSEFPDPETKRVISRQAVAYQGVIPAQAGIPVLPKGNPPPFGGAGMTEAVQKFRHAKTSYKVLNKLDAACILQLEPASGRMHQLRVHCAEAGCAILGDVLYAPPEFRRYPSMHLHAWRLKFQHPGTRKDLLVEAAPPFLLA